MHDCERMKSEGSCEQLQQPTLRTENQTFQNTIPNFYMRLKLTTCAVATGAAMSPAQCNHGLEFPTNRNQDIETENSATSFTGNQIESS